eukprot:gene50824-67060_t
MCIALFNTLFPHLLPTPSSGGPPADNAVADERSEGRVLGE